MQIYFSPEFINQNAQVLNIVTDRNEAIGYLSFLMEESKMYVFANLEEEGVCEDFKDLLKPYLQGLTKIKSDLEVMAYISVGGKKIDIELDKQ
ncbi:hypothetical protein BKP35_00710 [Anaerobacillus arseniciselenatis]|uniref:Uncharacterized protein n=1 Tax=Anaerobacillus arseniciselenatis TaxID=85682 RepID=A0A1S2LSQ7_9BACI|nr:hypothetical protein [Anaerobacillus arseniciselenatis]OIJ15548.1 hypothetical protein BKP35_00710 [Anaerobacillus arseniciselenatis]